ncbi:hypothetical protein Y10_02160 [Neptunitalea sp. Y10]|uniref:DUF4412 domain-containing protein n=2 Tax=Neptunitalea lumnitzerae TaxID=2965509 RepID=A0ABQ5MEP1_9FLAO|nr:hypothetical protein Y10_02160 [Neptunitalea sp. Y10]
MLAQNFEGSLSYSVDFELTPKMKEKGMTKEIVMEIMSKDGGFSKVINYWYKKDNYLLEVPNTGSKSIYIGEKNTLYSFTKENPNTIIATDVTINLDNQMYGNKPTVSVEDTDEVILGKKCKRVTISWSNGTTEYYFSPGFLPMDAKLYKDFNHNMWNAYLEKSNALPLRIVKKGSNDYLTFIMNLQNIDETRVSKKEFDLPEMVIDELNSDFMPANQKAYTKISKK